VALTVAIGFFPVGPAAGMAAKANGFSGVEVALRAVLINAAPVQFAVGKLFSPVAKATRLSTTHAWTRRGSA
jgi:predicted branched-subunit amino acid permease